MNVISGLRNSGFLAQSANSASIATNDDLGRKISTTYLTAVDLSESAHWEEATNAYEQASGTYLTSHQSLDGYATTAWVDEQGYLTGVSIPESATWQDVSTTVQSNSAQWADGGTGDEEVNSFVYDNSATINEVNTTYQQNSANYITAHQSLDGYATTAEVDTLSSMLSGAVDYVSANVGEGGVISSFTSAWSHLVPPYGDYVIKSLNGKYISAFLSNSADRAGFANNAELAKTASYANTVNVTNVENLGFVRNLSSEYGTISVIHNNLIESTNSAVLRTGGEGFVSSFQDKSIGPSVTATFSWDKSLSNTTFNFNTTYAPNNTTITYSANTNLTGEVTVTSVGELQFSVDVPNATSLNVWSNDWIQIKNNVASAADTFETTVGELAWASALPTFEYDNTNKISAINGSALAGGSEFPVSANEAITAYQNASGTYLTAHQDLSDYQTIAGMVNYYTTAEADTLSSMLSGAIDYVSANAGGGGGTSYVSPSGSIWISSNKIESTDSAYIPSHHEDVLLTATTSWSSMNGYATLANTNKVYFTSQAARAIAFDNEGTFLNSSYNTTAFAETEYPPIKLYTNNWTNVKFSAYSAGIMDAYVVELARKNEVNSALNTKLDSSAFKGYYPSNNPSGFAKASDVVMTSSLNLFDGRIARINNQSFIGCDSAYNYTFVGSSASTATKTASAYVGTGHQGVNIQISARNTGIIYINWTAFGENGSDLSAGQLYMYMMGTNPNKLSAIEFNSPLAGNISGVKLYGNGYNNTTAYSAYTSDVKQLASQDNVTFLSGAVDYVSANAQPSLSSLNDASVNNIIVTASLPATPDANTLYFIPET